jgi:hypothetical protein
MRAKNSREQQSRRFYAIFNVANLAKEKSHARYACIAGLNLFFLTVYLFILKAVTISKVKFYSQPTLPSY